MGKKGLIILFSILLSVLATVSAVVINADYVKTYPGEQSRIGIGIDNNENFDIEDFSIVLDLEKVPFTSVGSGEKNIDGINENDEEDFSFTLRANTDVNPGDYQIPYSIKYKNADSDENEEYHKEGSFGIRVSSKTELDFSVETKGDNSKSAIIGRSGQISLEIINRGLGEVKSLSVEIFPSGFELLSQKKVFVGSIDGDDTDLATFDVIFNDEVSTLNARILYKDFDNKDQEQTVNISLKVYTKDEALKKGLISDGNSLTYLIGVVMVVALWFVWRSWKKRKKRSQKT